MKTLLLISSVLMFGLLSCQKREYCYRQYYEATHYSIYSPPSDSVQTFNTEIVHCFPEYKGDTLFAGSDTVWSQSQGEWWWTRVAQVYIR